MKQSEKRIDLHVHSLVSDGSYTPAGLAKLARERGLSGFALTDHDNIAGDAEAAAAAQQEGIDFIPGMELTVEFENRKLHIVCLGFDAAQPDFQSLYRRMRATKEAKIAEIIQYIAQKGIDISLEKVQPFAYGRTIDRYAIMRYLVSLHLYDHAQPLWDNYLDPAVRLLDLEVNITAEEALPVIHKAGGVTSLAHFHKNIGFKGLSRLEQEAAILRLHQLGLDGMERWYPNYTAEDAAFAGYMIEKYELLPTGGTDFHGSNRPEIELGTGLHDNIAIPYAYLEGVRAACKKNFELEKEKQAGRAN